MSKNRALLNFTRKRGLFTYFSSLQLRAMPKKQLAQVVCFFIFTLGLASAIVSNCSKTFPKETLKYALLTLASFAGVCRVKGKNKTFCITILICVLLFLAFQVVLKKEIVLKFLRRNPSKKKGFSLISFLASFYMFKFSNPHKEEKRGQNHSNHPLVLNWFILCAKWAYQKTRRYLVENIPSPISMSSTRPPSNKPNELSTTGSASKL